MLQARLVNCHIRCEDLLHVSLLTNDRSQTLIMAAPFIAIWAPLEYFKTGEHVVEADIPSFKAVQGFNRSRNLVSDSCMLSVEALIVLS